MRVQNTDMELDNSMLDMKQLFFNNLQLLGFDAPAMEATNHIPFNRTMFELPNKRGAEIVLHYLFQRLNPTMCREAFRDCWPILDKKREQGFRKTCSNWLTNISQEEPDSHLPRINASLFMSPGGEKFYQLLFHFSGYVLQKVLDTELGSKMSERLKYPVLTSQNLQLGDVIIKDLTCSSIRHRTNYFSGAQLNVKASKTWKDTADEYVKEYRKLNKEIRELDYKVRNEEQKSVETSLARGSPGKRRSGQSEHFDPDFDPRTIKRAQRIQQVRDMWKQLEEFDRTEAAEREVVESIVERTINKYRLDAADISVKVPDMLLRECGEEIRRRNVDNTYQGGRLNLVSVLQLWNLCLHLYLEKINEVGVPKFEEEVKKLTSQVHVQQNYAQNAQTLRQQMSERIPVLKSSIEMLRAKLDTALFEDKSPESIRTTVSDTDSVASESIIRNTCSKLIPMSVHVPASKLEGSNVENRTRQNHEIGKNTYRRSENQLTKYTIDKCSNKIAQNQKAYKSNGRIKKEQLITHANTKCEVKLIEKSCKPDKTEFKGKDGKLVYKEKNLYLHPENKIELENCQKADRLKVCRQYSIEDGNSICIECGALCVCGQTALAMVSNGQSPNTSSAVEPNHTSGSGLKFDSPDSVLKSGNRTLQSEQSSYIEARSGHICSSAFTSHVYSNVGSPRVTPEKVQEFEKLLRSHNLHSESLNLELGNHSGFEVNPVTDLSVTGQSGSSGYMSYKNSEVSSLPEHSLLFDECSGMADRPLDIAEWNGARDISPSSESHKDQDIKHMQTSFASLPLKNISGQVTLTGKKFQPLKDMHIEEKVPLGGVLSPSERQVCSLKSCLPLKDMTTQAPLSANFDTTLKQMNFPDQQNCSSPCRKFSPLKDMSFTEEHEGERASLCNLEEVKSMVYKYVETNSDGEIGDVITLCSVDLDERKEINGQTEMDLLSESLVNRNKELYKDDREAVYVRDFSITLCQTQHSDYSDTSGLALSNIGVTGQNYASVKRSNSNKGTVADGVGSNNRSVRCDEVVNSSLRSIQVEESSGYKFYRSPKGSLKRVRFCFPTE